jgi:hypothetical protein
MDSIRVAQAHGAPGKIISNNAMGNKGGLAFYD